MPKTESIFGRTSEQQHQKASCNHPQPHRGQAGSTRSLIAGQADSSCSLTEGKSGNTGSLKVGHSCCTISELSTAELSSRCSNEDNDSAFHTPPTSPSSPTIKAPQNPHINQMFEDQTPTPSDDEDKVALSK
ncbi:unnamed protein product, partial [Meganyctiphanes norvegica]